MKSIQNIKLGTNAKIEEALKIIDSGAMQIALVVDENDKLIGTLTDGDIRRGLLGSLSLDDVVETIICKKPIVCSIDDSKEKIIKTAVEKNLHQIPIVDKDGKIVGIEVIDDLLRPKYKSNKVVLMVGGLGTRLAPLTNKTPKPMLKVGNKPILQTIVERFVEYGFCDITMCVNYKSHIIQDYFGDGNSFGATIEYVEEQKRMGTAGALSLLKNIPNEPFIVMNGDLLTNVNFDHFLNFHVSNNSVGTMCVREFDFQVPYGVVNLDGDRIKSIVEKPLHKFFVNAGIYILSPEVLKYIPSDRFYDMPTLFDYLIGIKKDVRPFLIREYWLDIGMLEELEKANLEYHKEF